MGRPPTCICESCDKCKRRVKARERYQALSLDERRALIARRDPEKVKAADRARYYRQYESRRDRMKRYAQENVARIAEHKRRWDERNPEKRRANQAVNNAVRDGKLVRQPCEECSAIEDVEAHHDDYSQPLEVRWLCTYHHGLTRRLAA